MTDEYSSSMLPAIMFIVIFFMFQAGCFYIYCHAAEVLQMEVRIMDLPKIHE